MNLYTNRNIYKDTWSLFDFVLKLELELNCKVKILEDYPLPDPGIHVFFALASWIRKNINWFKELKGIKIIIEHDAYMNFISGLEYHKFWSNMYHNHIFDLLLCSGKKITEKFQEEKVKCQWLPKGCPNAFFDMKNNYTGQIGCVLPPFSGGIYKDIKFSQPFIWKGARPPHQIERYKMTDHLSAFPEIKGFAVPWKNYPETILNFSGICLNDASMQEPMTKHFECSALGCVPIREEQSELYELGYDKTSMITYENFNHLKEIINYYQKHKEELIPIQHSTIEKSRNNTWHHRAKEAKKNHRVICKPN